MRIAIKTPTFFDVIDAPSPAGYAETVTFGIRSATFEAYRRFRWITPIAQYYGLVQEGLILAEHAFRGLNRRMRYEDDSKADERIFVYSWKPTRDYEWIGSPQDENALKETPPPPKTVFVVLVREESRPEKENDRNVVGTIEKWNWVREDPELSGAPIDWKVRYGERLWSRQIP